MNGDEAPSSYRGLLGAWGLTGTRGVSEAKLLILKLWSRFSRGSSIKPLAAILSLSPYQVVSWPSIRMSCSPDQKFD